MSWRMTKEKAEAGFLFLYRLYWLYWCYRVFISALMSSSGVVIGAMPYFSTRRFRILETKTQVEKDKTDVLIQGAEASTKCRLPSVRTMKERRREEAHLQYIKPSASAEQPERPVSIVTLPHIHQSWQTIDFSKIKIIETEFATCQG